MHSTGVPSASVMPPQPIAPIAQYKRKLPPLDQLMVHKQRLANVGAAPSVDIGTAPESGPTHSFDASLDPSVSFVLEPHHGLNAFADGIGRRESKCVLVKNSRVSQKWFGVHLAIGLLMHE